MRNTNFNFSNRQSLDSGKVNSVISSLEVSNEEPITGDVTEATTGEIKQRIQDTFPTQNRAVTQADYENICYRMPAKFGSIKRVSVQRDPDSQKRNLNLYTVSQDSFGKLIKSNSTIKNNLKTWINQYRMINDTVDILDPYILNFGIDFIVRPEMVSDKFDVLDRCVDALIEHYKEPFFIGEPIYISDIYKVLKDVEGVLDVMKVKINSKTGGVYSSSAISINKNLAQDGSFIIAPKNAIFELKYPEEDIVGKIK